MPFPGAKSEILYRNRCRGQDTRIYVRGVRICTLWYTEAGAKAVVRAEAETKANAAADALLAEEPAEAVAAATSALCKGKGRSKSKGRSSGKP